MKGMVDGPKDIDSRMGRLDRENRRCDGNDRFCTRGAVRLITVVPADGQGIPKPGAEAVEKKACTWHRQQFERSGSYHLISSVSLFGEQPGRGSTGIRFVA